MIASSDRAGLGDHLGEAALLGRQLAGGQHLGHHHDAVHRRADFVAHGGQEVALGDVGGLGGLLGDVQVGGALGDGPLQPGHVLGDGFVALADLGQHVVEAGHQVADLVVGLDLGGLRRSRGSRAPPAWPR